VPRAPMPPDVAELFARPNPAVVAVLRPDGDPMSVATWYLVEDDGTVLLNMDAERARVGWMREHPQVALTAVDEGNWYTHVSVRGEIVRWDDDVETALADIDRLARHYTGERYATRDRARISCWVRVDHWHGWGAAKSGG
jgi:PPOX class probable F420-dependent enzyme